MKEATLSDGLCCTAPDDQEISNRFRDDLLIFNDLIRFWLLHSYSNI